MQPFLDAVSYALQRAAERVGVLTSLISLSVFGVALLFTGAKLATAIAVFCFGLVGFLEAFHVQRHAEIVKRRQDPKVNALLEAFTSARHNWHPKIFKQFTHCGFGFNAIGFKELPLPIGLSAPKCPACGDHNLLEEVVVRFPGRVAIRFHCLCGFSEQSQKTRAELMQEAAELAGLPR
jgi:hypothetical protein